MVNKMELVDREKLIAQYSANPESKGFMELVQDDCVVEALKKAEVVDAVPVVHAKWEIYPSDRSIRCTNCKMEFSVTHMPYTRNYCPNCGAKMDLE